MQWKIINGWYCVTACGLTNAFSNAPLSPTDNQGRERAA